MYDNAKMANIDFKGGKMEWGFYSYLDWNTTIDTTKEHLSEDLLLLSYDHCMIDLGWYGLFSIMVILPEDDGKYSVETWDQPYARIPCRDQADMLIQLQRAIDIYPAQADAYAKKWRK